MGEPKSIDEINAMIESKLQAANDERYKDGFNAAVRLLLPQFALRDANLKILEEENKRLWSVIILRGQLEAVEEEVRLTFYIPDKYSMIRRLQRDGYWLAGIQKDFSVTKGSSIHFVQWFYFLQYCPIDLCDQIRGILHRERVHLTTFSALVARIYASTSSRIHKSSKPVDQKELMEGLQLYGMDDQRLLDCVSVLCEMKKLPLSNQPLSVATTPNSSRSATPSRVTTVALRTSTVPQRRNTVSSRTPLRSTYGQYQHTSNNPYPHTSYHSYRQPPYRQHPYHQHPYHHVHRSRYYQRRWF